MKTILKISGMHCVSCTTNIEAGPKKQKGISLQNPERLEEFQISHGQSPDGQLLR